MKKGREIVRREVWLQDESGFSTIEVLISLVLLSLLSISFIPLLLNSFITAANNTTMVTATQIVNQEIEGVRAVQSPTGSTPSCSDVSAFLLITLASVVDPRGVVLQPQWDATSCPSSYPGVVRARISVGKAGQVTPVAQAVTLIYVKSVS